MLSEAVAATDSPDHHCLSLPGFRGICVLVPRRKNRNSGYSSSTRAAASVRDEDV